MDPVKIQGIVTWIAPVNLMELRGFIGFLNFYQCFIKGFSTLAQVLHNLTKKNMPWQWTEKEQNTFEMLKQKVAEEPVLLFPQMTKPFEMEVDTSAIAIGAVLNQKGDNGKLHSVAYYSESFTSTEQNYNVYAKNY